MRILKNKYDSAWVAEKVIVRCVTGRGNLDDCNNQTKLGIKWHQFSFQSCFLAPIIISYSNTLMH